MKSPTAIPTPARAPFPQADFPGGLQEQIRVRAYQLYEQRGRTDGHDLEDWLRAEAELAEAELTEVRKAA